MGCTVHDPLAKYPTLRELGRHVIHQQPRALTAGWCSTLRPDSTASRREVCCADTDGYGAAGASGDPEDRSAGEESDKPRVDSRPEKSPIDPSPGPCASSPRASRPPRMPSSDPRRASATVVINGARHRPGLRAYEAIDQLTFVLLSPVKCDHAEGRHGDGGCLDIGDELDIW